MGGGRQMGPIRGNASRREPKRPDCPSAHPPGQPVPPQQQQQQQQHRSTAASAIDPDALLRQLYEHAVSTNSQFLILRTDASGDTVVDATDAFEDHKDVWIPESTRKQASQVARSAASAKKGQRRKSTTVKRVNGVLMQRPGHKGVMQSPVHDEPAVNGNHEIEDGWVDAADEIDENRQQSSGSLDPRRPAKTKKRPAPPPPLETDATSPRKKKVVKKDSRRKSASDLEESRRLSAASHTAIRVSDYDALTEFYENRLRQMQQLMCKVIAKSWIKVIEPKKQSNFPYNRGDESKPSWWPKNLRHKEPDHLMKPERLRLLLTMLRSQKVPISKLEDATKETIPSGQSGKASEERLPLLEELYLVAKQEERYRRGEMPPTTMIFVAASPNNLRPEKSGSNAERRNSVSSETSEESYHEESSVKLELSPNVEEPALSPRERPLGQIDLREEESDVQVSEPPSNPFSMSAAQPQVQALSQPLSYTSNAYISAPLHTPPVQDQGHYLSQSNHLNMNHPGYFVNYQQPPQQQQQQQQQQHGQVQQRPHQHQPTGRHSVSFETSTPPAPRVMRNNTIAAIPQHTSNLGYEWHIRGHMAPAIYSPYSPNTEHSPIHAPSHVSAQQGSAPPTPVTAGPYGQMQLPSHHNHQQMPPPPHDLGGTDPRAAGHQYGPPGMGAPMRAGSVSHQTNGLGFTEFFDDNPTMELAGQMDKRNGMEE